MINFDKDTYQFILDGLVWSYSNLSSLDNCRKIWYNTYIDKSEKKENFFSQYGSYMHLILEMFSKQQLDFPELVPYFEENYDKFITEYPPFENMGTSYYNQAVDFLSTFEGFTDKTVGTELKMEYQIELYGKKRDFVAYIDRLSMDDNGYIINDYKSKGKFSSKAEKEKYLRQLYIYSLSVKEKYGVFPYKLKFNHFRTKSETVELFNENKLLQTLKWADNCVERIYNTEIFVPNHNDFFCNHLCSVSDSCLTEE